jgi:hypothetical protein
LAVTRLARYARQQTEDGRDLVDHLVRVLRGEALDTVIVKGPDGVQAPVEVPCSVSVRNQAAMQLREWAFGKSLPASEMVDPEELPDIVLTGTSPTELLTQAQVLLVRLLATLEAQSRAGLPLAANSLGALSDAVRNMAVLRKTEEELAKLSKAGTLPDLELLAQVLRKAPKAMLAEALSRTETEEVQA